MHGLLQWNHPKNVVSTGLLLFECSAQKCADLIGDVDVDCQHINTYNISMYVYMYIVIYIYIYIVLYVFCTYM